MPPIVPYRRPRILPARPVTSRVADGFYWLGRYLERTLNLAKMIQVIETIEMEELNSADRKLYRPVWNRLLPPLESSGTKGRKSRSISSPIERFRLLLLSAESGSVESLVRTPPHNAHSLRQPFSPPRRLAMHR